MAVTIGNPQGICVVVLSYSLIHVDASSFKETHVTTSGIAHILIFTRPHITLRIGIEPVKGVVLYSINHRNEPATTKRRQGSAKHRIPIGEISHN